MTVRENVSEKERESMPEKENMSEDERENVKECEIARVSALNTLCLSCLLHCMSTTHHSAIIPMVS